MQDPLAALRPLHAPPAVSWWPPAPGWWLLALLAVVVAMSVFFWWRKTAPRRAALRELEALAAQPLQQAASINRLLKRYALRCWPAAGTASLSGENWLRFLDEHGGNGAFQRGPGRVLLTAPYSAETCAVEGLVGPCRRWIKANRPRAQG